MIDWSHGSKLVVLIPAVTMWVLVDYLRALHWVISIEYRVISIWDNTSLHISALTTVGVSTRVTRPLPGPLLLVVKSTPKSSWSLSKSILVFLSLEVTLLFSFIKLTLHRLLSHNTLKRIRLNSISLDVVDILLVYGVDIHVLVSGVVVVHRLVVLVAACAFVRKADIPPWMSETVLGCDVLLLRRQVPLMELLPSGSSALVKGAYCYRQSPRLDLGYLLLHHHVLLIVNLRYAGNIRLSTSVHPF